VNVTVDVQDNSLGNNSGAPFRNNMPDIACPLLLIVLPGIAMQQLIVSETRVRCILQTSARYTAYNE
jgi:hypothetical protein